MEKQQRTVLLTKRQGEVPRNHMPERLKVSSVARQCPPARKNKHWVAVLLFQTVLRIEQTLGLLIQACSLPGVQTQAFQNDR